MTREVPSTITEIDIETQTFFRVFCDSCQDPMGIPGSTHVRNFRFQNIFDTPHFYQCLNCNKPVQVSIENTRIFDPESFATRNFHWVISYDGFSEREVVYPLVDEVEVERLSRYMPNEPRIVYGAISTQCPESVSPFVQKYSEDHLGYVLGRQKDKALSMFKESSNLKEEPSLMNQVVWSPMGVFLDTFGIKVQQPDLATKLLRDYPRKTPLVTFRGELTTAEEKSLEEFNFLRLTLKDLSSQVMCSLSPDALILILGKIEGSNFASIVPALSLRLFYINRC